MGITLQWDNPEKTIVRWDHEGHWTWDELFQLQAQFDALANSVNYRVDVIINTRNSAGIPNDAPSQFQRLASVRPKRSIIIIVGANQQVESMLSLYGKSQPEAGKGIVVADTLDKARAMLANLRESGTEP